MNLMLNVLVLFLEILYYSLFMKFARKESDFVRLLFLFTVITIAGMFIGTNHLPSYLALILIMLFGLKYVVQIKVILYDMFIIFIMLILGILIQLPCYIVLTKFVKGLYVMMTIYQFIKLIVVILLRNKIALMYTKLYKRWANNDFYIRYIFSIFVFLYAIASCLFIIIILL